MCATKKCIIYKIIIIYNESHHFIVLTVIYNTNTKRN